MFTFRLDNTIELLNQKKPLPIVDETPFRSKIPVVTKVQDVSEVDKLEKKENEWKCRYDQLEDKYLDGQKQLNSTIEKMEKVYNEKLRTLESSVNSIKSRKFEEVEVPVKGLKKLEKIPSNENIQKIPEIIHQRRTNRPTSSKMLHKTPKYSTFDVSSSSSPSQSASEDESDQEKENLNKLNELAEITVHRADFEQPSIRPISSMMALQSMKQNPPLAAPRLINSTPQINIIEKSKKKVKSSTESIDFKNSAISAFQERMMAMGLDEKHKIRTRDFPAINEEIVKNREGIRKV